MSSITIKIADETDRQQIYRIRHEVYAKELHQHEENQEQLLRDNLDDFNTYIVVKMDGNISGFVSITPPNGKYGLDKYIGREKYPFLYDNMYEGRLFTVLPEYRTGCTALLLFFSAFRYAEEHRGDKIMTIGRIDLVDFYKKTGLIDLGETIHSGEVDFRLMYAKVSDLRKNCAHLEKILKRYLPKIDNRLPFPLLPESRCYHGGQFFEAIGSDFSTLEKSREIINADVLDAWFDPSPRVTAALEEYLPWAVKTSPPTHSEGLVRTISETRGIARENVLAGGGSSGLMYLAFPRLLKDSAKVLLLNPTYGEYEFIFRNLLHARIDRFALRREENYRFDLERLIETLHKNQYDLFVIVNPNNPTGQYLSREQMEQLVEAVPKSTLLWIDETYIEYTGPSASMERKAAASENVIVCKSMSKVYALSGMRCAYLAANAEIIRGLSLYSPPWAVSLPAQIAAVNALQDAGYYEACWRKTEENRRRLAEVLSENEGLKIFPGVINAVLCELPQTVEKKRLISRCMENRLYIRDVSNMGSGWNEQAIRIAVKDEETNQRIAEIFHKVYYTK